MSLESFKSYVDIGAEVSFGVDGGAERPALLAGEAVIAAEEHVLHLAPLSERKHGRSGALHVTNFKLAFAPSGAATPNTYHQECQQNRLLGEFEVSLCNIDSIYHVSRDKKRKLVGGQSVSSKIKGLLIVCKNMRTLTFSFKISNVDSGKKIANALLHYAFPRRHHLLFAYDFREPYVDVCREEEVCKFREQADWEMELRKSGCSGWRVSACNETYDVCPNLPRFIVVPEVALDFNLREAAGAFRGNRVPVWCWGLESGAALVRMADLVPGVPSEHENAMLERVRRAHPHHRAPKVIDLAKALPTPRDLLLAHRRLRELFVPDTAAAFWRHDADFLSRLDASRWLHYVAACLTAASTASQTLLRHTSVVLQEGEGRDTSTIVSCLTQIMSCSWRRTLSGFEELVQKEWVALGHPFVARLGLVADAEEEQAPMFLLFLDCVWQLTEQFPDQFEFTETYLTTLWDSCHVGIFDTFLFNCERDRRIAEMDCANPFRLRSAWRWEEQLEEGDVALFRNPLYGLRGGEGGKERLLAASCGLSSMAAWLQCYGRWVPQLEVRGGGRPPALLRLHSLAAEVAHLRSLPLRPPAPSLDAEVEALRVRLLANPSSFFPFARYTIPSATSAPSAAANDSLLDASLDSSALSESTYSLSTAV